MHYSFKKENAHIKFGVLILISNIILSTFFSLATLCFYFTIIITKLYSSFNNDSSLETLGFFTSVMLCRGLFVWWHGEKYKPHQSTVDWLVPSWWPVNENASHSILPCTSYDLHPYQTAYCNRQKHYNVKNSGLFKWHTVKKKIIEYHTKKCFYPLYIYPVSNLPKKFKVHA